MYIHSNSGDESKSLADQSLLSRHHLHPRKCTCVCVIPFYFIIRFIFVKKKKTYVHCKACAK